ncbi:comEA protein-related protein [unidentified eubacterium SCB49]|nr:comEA protein-related protein [unidentified eubacterium SCB49]
MKSQFVFNKSERFGILLLVALIIGSLLFYFLYTPDRQSALDISSPEVIAVNTEVKVLKAIALEEKKPKIYPFNPNFITEYKAYTLGMSVEEHNRLQRFRQNDKWVNSIQEFQMVTKVSDSLLDTFSSYFKFPDWVTNPKTNSYTSGTFPKKKEVVLTFAQKTDLNVATAEQLQKVSGIGPAISERIIKYRDKTLQGFSNEAQLASVWGVDSVVIARTLKLFAVKTPKLIEKMNVNTASASDIATIKGISFDLAKEIWEYRVLREQILSLDELATIDGITTSKLNLIKLYLSAD